MISYLLAGAGGLAGFLTLSTFLAVLFRRVVPTNEVHIVQSSKTTTSYGKDTGHGNTYYQWPSWVPFFGVTKIVLPVNVFDEDLLDYEAYDRGRLPFLVDIKAFFRITDSNIAAQRIASFSDLREQLRAIVQGAVRTILASSEIEEIMQGRSKFGEEFTREVSEQLTNWGVGTVKNIELMDIRDAKGSTVIHNIMEKKKSLIEMESRQEVAKNKKTAQIAEITANREVDVEKQNAAQLVGLRKTEADRKVAIAQQEMAQSVKEQEKLTKEKEMSVLQVQQVRAAEIAKQVKVVQAEQDRDTAILTATGQKEALVVTATGSLEAKKREAEGIAAEGEARASAEKAMLLAPVESQITLAKEIGGNKEYQQYLITVEQIKAGQAVGVEQAKALVAADIKIIANSGDPVTGMGKAMDLFSSSGGTRVGALLEGLKQTEAGKALLDKVIGG